MRKIIDLGKVHYNGRGKINPVTIDIELRRRGGDAILINGAPNGEYTPTYTELSICGNIWNQRMSDVYSAGQNLDNIMEYINDMSPENQELFKKIYDWWKKYHLNGMHAGTKRQELVINKWLAKGNKYDYREAVALLTRKGLNPVVFSGKTVGRKYNHELYYYGHGWVVNEIPKNVLAEIRTTMQKYGK